MFASSVSGTTVAPQTRRRLRDEILHHGPVPGAMGRIHVSEQTGARRGLRTARVNGPRDDVIGYVSYLFATDIGIGETAMQIVDVEEIDGELTLVLVYLEDATGAP